MKDKTFLKRYSTHSFIITWLLNFLWINISEIFRYFLFVMPIMRQSFPQIPNVAPMNLPIFLSWGVWDIILITSFMCFIKLYFERFGTRLKHCIIAATTFWIAVFGLLWLGLYNMNLATPDVLMIAMPLSWFELLIASLIASWGLKK